EGITYDSETLSQLIPVITCSGADVSKFYKVKVTGSITVKKASVMLTMNDYFANEGTGLFSQNDDFNFPCSVQLGSSFSKKNLSLYSLTINIANPESNDPSALSDIYFTKKSNPDICILKDDIEYVFIGKAASSQKHVIINFDDTAKGFSVYDGREVDPADSQYWEYTSTSTFSNGHKLKFDYSLTILEIGSYDMSYSDGVGENLNNVTVLDENNNDVTKLYSIEVTGSFTIRKGLVVFSGSDFVTDNQSSLHYENTFTDSSKVLPVSIDLKKSVLNPAWEVSDLAFSYSLKTEASQLETPTSDNVFTLNSLAVYGTSVSFDNGNLDYEFDTSDFTASLTKKEIALDFGVVSQVFNGKDLDLSQLNVPTDTNSVLGQDESIEISGTLTKENTGILSFQNLYQNNILLIKILDKDDNDITSFFDISISGTLYFDRITIDFNCDATKTEHIYDGKQISLLSSYFTARIKGSSRVYEGGKISSFTVNNSLYPFVDAGSYSIEATQLSYTFTDAQGNVIDSQYVNTLINGKSSLEINIEKRDLIFDFGSKGYIYDGQEKDLNQIFTSALEEGCSLADGDVLSLEYGNSICDEGEYDLSQVIIKITNSSGKDVTSNYNISLKNSNIYVEKAVVNVVISSDSIEYDGLSHSPDITATVMVDHLNSNDFNFDSLSSDISLLTVGSIDLNHDSSGTDFSLNLFYDSQLMDSQYYDINVTVSGNGIFEITLADLYVDYGEKTLVYDGSGHDLADPGLFAVSGLKENDSLMFDQLIKSETGTYEMDSLISGYQIIGSDIQSRNNCYNLIVTGQVELYQIQITVTQTGGQWTYDGCLHQPTMTYVASDLSQQLCSISVVSNIGFTKAGTYQIPSSYSSDDYTIVVKQKSDNRIIPNDCLNIMVDTVGDCVINKADLDIDFGSHSYIYDGQEYDFSSLTNYQIQGLETTDTLIIDEAVYVNKGTYDFSNENYMPVFHILNQENEDVKFCYNINFTGTLVLKSAVLTIDFTSESTTITYDGLNHYFTFTYSLDDEFASDYAVNVNNLIFFKNAGIYYAQAGDDDFDISFTNLLNPSRVLDSSFVQILIVSSDAVFTIEKKAIVLDFENWVLMYTGREYSITDLGNKAFAAGNSLLASNDSLVFASADKYLNLGSYDMGNISVSVVDSEGQDMTGNYSFGFLNSSITIERAILSISASGNQAIIYDGKAHYYSLNYEFDSRFASDYSVSVVSVGYTTVGEYALGRDSFIITVTSNVDSYIIDSDCLIVNISTVSNDSISISKCDLTLDFGTNNFIYDGNSYSVWDYLITNETLTTNGDTIDNHPDYSLTEMGEYDLSSFDFSSISIIDSEGENRTSCYNLLIEGVIKICQGRLTITVENSTYVYDGQSHYLIITSYDFSGFESHSGNNQFSVEIDVASSISLINVGRVDVLSQENLSFIVRDSNDEVISNEYIDLVVISDTPNLPYIEITPYELEIDLSSNTRIYTGNDYSVNEFLKTYQTTFGDTITISNGLTASLAEIGSYDFSSFDIEYHILSTLGADITPNYSVSFTGDLEIIRAEINFINDDLEFTYTGQLIELSLQNFPHTDNLPAGYSVTDMACNNGNYLVGQYAFEDLSVTQLTITFNDIPVTFKTDFHDFVSISFSNNSLIINKAILNVDLSNTIKDVYYDGTTYAIEDIIPLSAFEICSTDRISIGYEETLAFGENEIINHVTTFEIGLSKGLSYSIIHQTDGADVTFCYQMNFTDVSFSITQIYIELTVSNDSKVYDGQVLSYMSGPSYSCLMPGDLAVFTLSTPSSDFGDYQMTLDNLTFVISDSDGKVLFSSEYKRDYVIIDLQPVTFSITKADLVLNFETTIRPYAGHSYGFSDIYDFDEIVNSALPSLLMNKASLVFDSTIEFQFENGVDTNYDLSLYLNNLKVFLNSVTDITSNFNISLAGTFSVISCSLSFDFGSENETYNQKIYDGENFSPSSLENYLVQTNLPTRYQVLVLDINNSKAVSGTDYGLYVGTYDYLYECISFEVRDEKGNVVFYHHFDNDEDCSHLNLSIAGKFEISERPIQIGSDSTLIYTGNIYDVSFLFKNTDPAPDDSISYSFTYPTLSQTTTYSNDEIFDFTIKNTAGFDVTSNYVITISGSITFLVVNLSVDVTEPTRYYDGKGFSAEDLILSSGNLPEGYLFSCEGDFSFVEAGQYQLDSSLITIHLFDALGEEIIFANGNAYDYINCTFVTDTMTINPTPLTISLSQTTHVYDGQKADLNSLIEYELGNPALSQINIEAVGYYSDLIDVGVYQLTEENLSISINNGYRIYVSDNSNFEITFLTSQFEITKKTLVLNFGQQTTYYSGENIYVSYYQTLGYENGIITSDENSDLVSGQTIFFDEYGNEKFYEIGTYDFSLTDYLPKIRITDSETKETTSNYDITIIGSITIEKLSIELTIVSQVLTYSSSYPTIRYVVSGGSILADGRYEVSGSSTLNYFNVGTYGYSDLGPMTISAMFEGKTVEMKEENMTITIKGTERFTCVIKKATIYVSTQSIFSEYQGEINTLESSYLGGFTVKNGFRAARVMYLTDSGELDAVGNHYRTSYSGNENNIYDNTIVDDVSRLVIAESRYDSNNNYFLADATANYNVVYQFGKIYFEVY
ncbi:MAG: hypothetical protein WCR67_02100, partial [Bacilli bacterium]